MKKLILLLLAAVLVCSVLVLYGCTQTAKDNEESSDDSSLQSALDESNAQTGAESESETEAEGVQYLLSEFPDYSEYVTLGQYKGIEVAAVGDTAVTDEQLKAEIQALLEDNATVKEVADRPVQSGDTVNIDYTGYVDGVAFEGGADTNFDLTIGSGKFIPGFEDAIIGHEAGTTFTIDVTFPEIYNEALAGKAAQFEIVLHSISETILPEYTDSLIQSVSEYNTTAEFEEALKELLLKENEEKKLTQIINSAFSKVIENTTVNGYPEEKLSELEAELLSSYQEYATYYGYEDLESYLTEMYGMTLEAFNEQATLYAQSSLAEEMIVFSIAAAEKIEITASEYQEGAMEYAELYGYTTVSELEEYYGTDLIRESLLWDKVLEFVAANAVEVEG